MSRESQATKIAVIASNVENIKGELSKINIKLDTTYVLKEEFRRVEENYVSQVEFKPIKQIVYGVVGLILVAVVGGLLGLVLIN